MLNTTSNDTNPIYYYRGAVDNNNVIFADFCWKIVRTTETGGVKLIYNGTPTNGTCNNTGTSSQIGTSAFNTNYNDNAYVGYMYGTTGATTYEDTHKNTNDSTIKTAIDTWYRNNMTTHTDKLEDTIWCNDRSIVTDLANSNGGYFSGYTTLGYGTNRTVYGATSRVGYNVTNPTPSLVCSQDNDKFTVDTTNGNGALEYPIGLITADEIAYAGGKSDAMNSSYYLYTGQIYWAGSPYDANDDYGVEFGVWSDGNLMGIAVSGVVGVRPSVSLKPGTTIKMGGTGTASNPYVVK